MEGLPKTGRRLGVIEKPGLTQLRLSLAIIPMYGGVGRPRVVPPGERLRVRTYDRIMVTGWRCPGFSALCKGAL